LVTIFPTENDPKLISTLIQQNYFALIRDKKQYAPNRILLQHDRDQTSEPVELLHVQKATTPESKEHGRGTRNRPVSLHAEAGGTQTWVDFFLGGAGRLEQLLGG
jgi:hypothetical protein